MPIVPTGEPKPVRSEFLAHQSPIAVRILVVQRDAVLKKMGLASKLSGHFKSTNFEGCIEATAVSKEVRLKSPSQHKRRISKLSRLCFT